MELREAVAFGAPVVISVAAIYLHKFRTRDYVVDRRAAHASYPRTVYDDTVFMALPAPLDLAYRWARYRHRDPVIGS